MTTMGRVLRRDDPIEVLIGQVRDAHQAELQAIQARWQVEEALLLALAEGMRNAGKRKEIPLVVMDMPLMVNQVAKILQCSIGHVYQLVRSGELVAVRNGRSIRIRQSEVDRYVG